MQITQEQYEKIAKYLPTQRGNVSMTNLQLINAILYVTENGCKWRALPESYGNWHTAGTEENDLLYNRWDQAASAMEQLQAEDIPVLWRPFHEFDGQWFWWGKEGPDAFRTLWRRMYEHFEKDHGLQNLIWVLGYSGEIRPGWEADPALFDAVGSDTYNGETTHGAAYRRLKELYPGKLLCFHECGLIPPLDAFFDEGCPWSWIMPWHGNFLMNNHPSRIMEAYRDERMIPLSRLPRF